METKDIPRESIIQFSFYAYTPPKKGINFKNFHKESIICLGYANINFCDWRGILRDGYHSLILENGERNTLHATDFDNPNSIVLKFKLNNSPFPIYCDSPLSIDQMEEPQTNLKNVNNFFFLIFFNFFNFFFNFFF